MLNFLLVYCALFVVVGHVLLVQRIFVSLRKLLFAKRVNDVASQLRPRTDPSASAPDQDEDGADPDQIFNSFAELMEAYTNAKVK